MSQEVSPEVVHYHLELAEGILETCPMTQSFIPNPAIPIVSDLASAREEKMQSLDDFLAEFVDGEAYAEYIESIKTPIIRRACFNYFTIIETQETRHISILYYHLMWCNSGYVLTSLQSIRMVVAPILLEAVILFHPNSFH